MSIAAIAYIYERHIPHGPIPVAARSKAWYCDRSLVGSVGSSPAGGKCVFVCCECCVLSCRCLCVGLITRLEKSYRL